MTNKEIERAVNDYIGGDLFNKLDPPPQGQIRINQKGMVVLNFADFVRIVEADAYDKEYVDEIKETVAKLKRTKG